MSPAGKTHVIIMGPPGAGKGTQAVAVMRELNLEHLSTGDVLRSEVEHKTELGIKANDFMVKGQLVPDQVVIDMVAGVIQRGTAKNGFLLDGFPRNRGQAEALDQILSKLGATVSCVINLDVPEATLLERIAMRADTETPRTDDKRDILKARLQVYVRDTKPLIDYYSSKKLMHNINGNQSREQVFAAIKRAVGK